LPKRKKLPPLKDPACICGHKESCHWKYEDAPGHGRCKHTGEDMREVNASMYCPCNKFVDMRHCVIKRSDPVFYRFTRLEGSYVSQEDCRTYDKVSAAMASRRFNFFKCLGLIKSVGWANDGIRDSEQFSLVTTRLKELVKLGVIV